MCARRFSRPPLITVPKLSFDLTDTKKWEYVLADQNATGFEDDTDEMGLAKKTQDSMKEEEDEGKFLLDIPPSWVRRLHIPRELYQNRCPMGHKVVTYRK